MTNRYHQSLAPLALGLAMLGSCDSADRAGPSAAPKKGGGPKPAVVELGEVQAGDLEDQWSFLGRVEPLESVQLAPAVDGRVVRVKVREGDAVKKGQSLVLLDAATYRAELSASRARETQLSSELSQARRESERIAKLSGLAASKPEKERLATRVETLEAQLAAQRAESQRIATLVSRHSLRAPFDGVVRARTVDPGAWVNTGGSILELVSLAELEILVEVSQTLAPHIKKGGAATLHPESGDGSASAVVVGVVPALDPTTRTMRVRLRPTERPEWLLAGMAVNVEFPVALSGQGVTVPRDALVRGPVKVRVVIADGQISKPVDVEVIATTNDKALVRSPELHPGDKVVVRGNERLRPGQRLAPAGRDANKPKEPSGP